MRGPIVTSSQDDVRIDWSSTTDTTYEPAAFPPEHGEKVGYTDYSVYVWKIGYREVPVARWLGRLRPLWSYEWPLPYDTYGIQLRKKPHFEFVEHRRTRNTSGIPGWRFQHVVRHQFGLPGRIPLAPAVGLPGRKYEGLLLNRARISIGDQKANLLVTLKELGQTATMMRSRVKKMADVVALVRKGNFIGAARLLGMRHPPPAVRSGRRWADNFLEYQYGWVPLVHDTIGYAEYLVNFLGENPIIVGKAFVKVTKPVTRQTSVLSMSFGSGYNVRVATDTTVEETHRVTLSYRLKDPFKRELAQLQLLSPLSTGWELKSLSFVWDWVFRVGEFLEASDALLGLEYHSGSFSRVCKATAKYKLLGVTVPPASGSTTIVSSHASLSAGSSEGFVMRREIYDEIPPVQFVVALPGMDLSTVKQGIVSCALLRQRLSLPNTSFPRK